MSERQQRMMPKITTKRYSPGGEDVLQDLIATLNDSTTAPRLIQLLKELNDPESFYPFFIGGRRMGPTVAYLARRVARSNLDLDLTGEPRFTGLADWIDRCAACIFGLPEQLRIRLRQCRRRGCGLWFFARTRNQWTHSDACRVAFHRRQTEHGREQTRKYRQEYRRRERAEQQQELE